MKQSDKKPVDFWNMKNINPITMLPVPLENKEAAAKYYRKVHIPKKDRNK